MGKHSKPRKKSRTPLWATALLPVGVLAGAATAGAELSGNTLAPTPVSAPQVTSEAPTTPPSVTPAVKAHPLAPTPPPPPVRPASVTTGAVPVTNYDAYEAAAKSVTSTHPRCGIDWKVIAGIGNVYRAEILFRAGIDPMRPGKRVLRDEFDALWSDLVTLMKIGVRRGRIHVIRPEDDSGAPSYAPNRPRTYVYRRGGGPCPICGEPVPSADLAARKLYWCPVCQT